MKFWTEERLDIAAKMWRDGSSAAKIAKTIGGVSRNAVLGIMNRRRDLFPLKGDMPDAPKRYRSASSAKKSSESKPVKAPAPKIERPKRTAMLSELGVRVSVPTRPSGPFQHRDAALGGAPAVSFFDLAGNHCRWPLTDFGDADGPDMPCCGRPRRGGSQPDSAYCAEHAAVSRGAA